MKKYSFIKSISICGLFVVSNCAALVNPQKQAGEGYEYLSPASLAADNESKIVYIADATAQRITVLDARSDKVIDTIFLKRNPGDLAISPEGKYLYITSGSSDGIIEIIDLAQKKVTGSIPAGHTPCAPVVSPDGKKLYVCNRFENSVSVLDLIKKREIVRIPMLREPIAACSTPDGKFLFVANHIPSGGVLYDYIRDGGIMMIGNYISQGAYNGNKMDYAATGVILVVDTSNYELKELIPLPDGATGLRGICVSPDGRNLYVTHILANYKVPTARIEQGSINANAMSIIDVPALKLLDTVLLDDIDHGAANPWDVVCSPDGKYVCITHSGTHEISVIDRSELHNKLERAAKNKSVNAVSPSLDVKKDLTFLIGLRRRFQLEGNGPRGMAIVGTKVYTAEYFSDSVSMIDFGSAENHGNSRSIKLGTSKGPSETRKGEMLFHDARICFQEWQSCASCHPEGRTDGLTWDLLNDGVGNPKKTRSLLLSHKTPPVMITGIRPDAETAVRAGIKNILFSEQTEEKAANIDMYLRSLQPVPSPHLNKGRLNQYAKRGKKIFLKAGCAECHNPPLYTDMKKHDVGTGIDKEKNCMFDTPTLIELWRTAPYLYDGRAEMMHEVFLGFNKNDKHGSTSRINYKDLYCLTEFVLSL
jgi:YVTN family beta-propeller protein